MGTSVRAETSQQGTYKKKIIISRSRNLETGGNNSETLSTTDPHMMKETKEAVDMTEI